jgi:hypothetical protein
MPLNGKFYNQNGILPNNPINITMATLSIYIISETGQLQQKA